MNSSALIESGLLELYCLGETTPRQDLLIETLLTIDSNAMDELYAIEGALEWYAFYHARKPSVEVLKHIFISLARADSSRFRLPPLLSPQSVTADWWQYLSSHSIDPAFNGPLGMFEFINEPALSTYLVWAEKGAVVTEKHEHETELLLMLQGSCTITMRGETRHYAAGDFIEIAPGVVHYAEATSDELMILVGQKVAA